MTDHPARPVGRRVRSFRVLRAKLFATLYERYERNRKRVNENVGLVVAVVAAAAAAWTGYEAHKSRIDAATAADASFKVQRDIANAQIRALQAAQTPVIAISPSGPATIEFTRPQHVKVVGLFEIIAVGATPAFQVFVKKLCGTSNSFKNRDVATLLAGQRSQGLVETLHNTNPRWVDCTVEFEQTDHSEQILMFLQATNSDVFGNRHSLTYCFSVPTQPGPQQYVGELKNSRRAYVSPVPCMDFNPRIRNE
jgi:hypothetical protein